MDRHDLAALVERFGDSLVGLEDFARLTSDRRRVGQRLRARQRKSDFPVPVRPGIRAQFRLHDLVEDLAAASPTPVRLGPPEVVQRWTVEERAARCAADHGAERTFHLLAGLALTLAAGWRPAGSGPTLLAQARAAEPDPPVVDLTALPAGFVPDPPSVADRALMDALLGRSSDRSAAGVGVAEIADDDGPANLLADEMVRSAVLLSEEAFATLVLDRVGLLASGRERARPTTARAVSELMVRLADVGPGQIVCDPAVGEALSLAAACSLTDRDGRQTVGAVGRDLSPTAHLLARLRLGLAGVAYELGEPGFDSVATPDPPAPSDPAGAAPSRPVLHPLVDGRYDRIVTEPGFSTRDLRRWLDRIRALLAPNGVAVVQCAAESVIPSPGRERGWWAGLEADLAAIVIAPFRSGRSLHSGLFVIRPGFDRDILRIRIGDASGPAWSKADTDPDGGDRAQVEQNRAMAQRVANQTDLVVALVAAHVAGSALPDVPDDADVDVIPIPQLTLGAFEAAGIRSAAPPRSRRAKRAVSPVDRRRVVVAGAVDDRVHDGVLDEARVVPGAEFAEALQAPDDEPPRLRSRKREVLRNSGRSSGADVDDERYWARGAVRRLRWLVASPDDQTIDHEISGPPEVRGLLAAESTEEMRRALKRLDQRLQGREGRGRPKGSGQRRDP